MLYNSRTLALVVTSYGHELRRWGLVVAHDRSDCSICQRACGRQRRLLHDQRPVRTRRGRGRAGLGHSGGRAEGGEVQPLHGRRISCGQQAARFRRDVILLQHCLDIRSLLCLSPLLGKLGPDLRRCRVAFTCGTLDLTGADMNA